MVTLAMLVLAISTMSGPFVTTVSELVTASDFGINQLSISTALARAVRTVGDFWILGLLLLPSSDLRPPSVSREKGSGANQGET